MDRQIIHTEGAIRAWTTGPPAFPGPPGASYLKHSRTVEDQATVTQRAPGERRWASRSEKSPRRRAAAASYLTHATCCSGKQRRAWGSAPQRPGSASYAIAANVDGNALLVADLFSTFRTLKSVTPLLDIGY